MENELHTQDTAYVAFCGSLASEYMLGNQWGASQAQCTVQCPVTIQILSRPPEMCNGNSAPNTINSCNGACTSFIEQYGQNGLVLKTQPALWTE